MTTLLTEKEVIEEFFMNSNTIQNGIDNGSLNVIRKSKHGVPFICFDRAEIENMASTVMPDLVLKTKIEKESLLEFASRDAEISKFTIINFIKLIIKVFCYI
jgi:hypothetical protein